MASNDLKRFCALPIDFASIGLMEPGVPQSPYFCTPLGAEHVGRLGVDGVHFILLPGNRQVFCVEPSMGEAGSYVLPVGGDFLEFLSFVLFCRGANPLSQIAWLDEGAFRKLLAGEAGQPWPERDAALAAISSAFGLAPADPFARVKALQAEFDPGCLRFSGEYYDLLGIEHP